MKLLEVLRVRVTKGKREGIMKNLFFQKGEMKNRWGVSNVEIYENVNLDADFAVLLYWEETDQMVEQSVLSKEIEKGLQANGLVHHILLIQGDDYEY